MYKNNKAQWLLLFLYFEKDFIQDVTYEAKYIRILELQCVHFNVIVIYVNC